MKDVSVHKDFLTEQEGFKLWTHANNAQYERNWMADIFTHRNNGRFVHHINPDIFLEHYANFWVRLEKEMGFKLDLLDAYINFSNAHTVTLTHYDSFEDDFFTVLIFVNQEWNKDWAGYTAFFKEMDKNEFILVEVPEYRKMIIFKSSIPHYALPPTITAPDRFTLALKTRKINE